MKKSLLSLAIAATITIASGCGGGGGGGGGGGDAATPTAPETTASKVTGTAAAGIIKNGIVTAYELGSSGEPLQVEGEDKVVGTTRTDTNGQYNLVFNDKYDGGIVKVVITADLDTDMVCDAFGDNSCAVGKGFGVDVKLPNGFALNAIVNPVGSDAVSVQITPLTHMAAARAVSSGSVSAESVANAISEVSSLAGVNIMNTAVPDITRADSLAGASENAKQLALFNAGLASVLFDGDVSGNFNGKLDDLATTFADGDFDNDDAITIEDISDAVSGAVTAAAANNAIQAELEEAVATVAAVVEVIESETADGGYNPEPTDGANQSKIDQAKSLITDARTFIEKIGEDFEDPIDALSVDAETAGEVLNEDTAVMAALLGEALSQVIENIDSRTTLSQELDNPQSYTVVLVNGANGETIDGEITATFSTNGGISLTLDGTLTGSELEGEVRTVSLTNLKVDTSLTPADLTINDDVLENFSANNVQLILSGLIGNDDTSLELADVAMGVSTTGVNIDLTDNAPENQSDNLAAAVTAASFDGQMVIRANNATFSGDVEVKLVDMDENVKTENPLSVQKVSIDGVFTSAKGTFTSGASLTISNAANFDTFGFLNYEDEYFTHFSFPYTAPLEDQLKVVGVANKYIAENGGELVDGRISFSSANGGVYTLHGTFTTGYLEQEIELSNAFEVRIASEFEKEVGGTVESLNVWGSSYGGSGIAHGWAEATFEDLESADNFVQGTAMLTSSLNVPDLPEASVVATFNRTDLAGGDVSITVAHAGQSFTLETATANVDAAEPEATLTLTNADGVKMLMNLKDTISDGATVLGGTVSVAGTVVGTVSETDSGLVLVRYTDGSFESLY